MKDPSSLCWPEAPLTWAGVSVPSGKYRSKVATIVGPDFLQAWQSTISSKSSTGVVWNRNIKNYCGSKISTQAVKLQTLWFCAINILSTSTHMHKFPCVGVPLLPEVDGFPWHPDWRVETDTHVFGCLTFFLIPLNANFFQCRPSIPTFILN